MLINDDRLLDLRVACFSKSPGARERISRKLNVCKYDTHKFFQPRSGQRSIKSVGLKGFQIIYPAGGAQMSHGDPVVSHVRGKPSKYDTSSAGDLYISSNNVKWRKP